PSARASTYALDHRPSRPIRSESVTEESACAPGPSRWPFRSEREPPFEEPRPSPFVADAARRARSQRRAPRCSSAMRLSVDDAGWRGGALGAWSYRATASTSRAARVERGEGAGAEEAVGRGVAWGSSSMRYPVGPKRDPSALLSMPETGREAREDGG